MCSLIQHLMSAADGPSLCCYSSNVKLLSLEVKTSEEVFRISGAKSSNMWVGNERGKNKKLSGQVQYFKNPPSKRGLSSSATNQRRSAHLKQPRCSQPDELALSETGVSCIFPCGSDVAIFISSSFLSQIDEKSIFETIKHVQNRLDGSETLRGGITTRLCGSETCLLCFYCLCAYADMQQ